MRETTVDPYHELAKLIARTQSRIEKEINAVLQAEDARLTAQHWAVLEELSASEGKAMGEIQKSTLINDSTLTKLVDRLISLNLAYRAPAAEDRRKVLILLSRIGVPFIEKVRNTIADRRKLMFDAVSLPEVDAVRGALSVLNSSVGFD